MASVPSTPDHLLIPVAAQATYAQKRAQGLTNSKVKLGQK